ncbi:glutamate-ammonia-ligase adenylyltransferase [gamma proteobacterium NOR5-3]|nr:glutamate-ammonia-ligase adenylyltransferase [gamma proteobacterium NOR5-3]
MIEHASLPEPLQGTVAQAWTAIVDAATPAQRTALEALLAQTGFSQQLATVLAGSRYVAETLRRRPWLLLQLCSAGEFETPLRDGVLESELRELLARSEDDAAVVLRRFRQRQMLRIIWRDLNRLAPTLETTRDVSWLADACITLGLKHCTAELEARYGRPLGARSGEHQELVVLAMGKLGAHELNLSSDIDLIFTYPERGNTQGAKRSISNEEFFTRVGRALIALLDPVTAEGFVFRVDMRLRPYGESGSLVQSFAGLEAYYQEQGRDWERYALIKARPVTGPMKNRQSLMACLQPFVYRRYVDYSAIESLRAMKQLIVAEVRRRGLQGNVKLGSGGIREIEFIAQCFQLIRGGRDSTLQRRELSMVLAECAHLGCLPQAVVQDLQAAYLFLRDVEHAIQAWEDRQTQELPEDEQARAALAFCMGFADYPAFIKVLDAHRLCVSEHFAALIAEAEDSTPAPQSAGLWGAECDPEQLSNLGFKEVDELAARLRTLFESRRVQSLQTEGRERLDRFMPLLLEACAESEYPDQALERALPLVTAVARRSAYLLLLIENPPALADLAALCGASPWIAEQLTTRPALLDELLDRASLYTAPERETLQSELRQQLARLTVDDLEGHMDALRYFKASQVLRVAASELSGRLPLMKVSDKLSFIAEVCLEQVLALAWAQLALRYGEPSREGTGRGFVVLAYGKLGGIELSYASDLDLVFIFDATAGGYTDGERSIDNATFYIRLGQKMIHILETRMGLGQLYEVDMRLRPSGASGLLVSTLSAFERYQRDDAWTWEHQALVRARPVAGDQELADKVDKLRRDILCAHRDTTVLAREVVSMREKMRSHAKVTVDDSELDLKQGFGGIVDIEFMVQYAVLAWASQDPSLADWSDNVRILEVLARSGYLQKEQCQALVQAYLELRSATHQLALQQTAPQQQTRNLPTTQFSAERSSVQLAWESLFAGVQVDEISTDGS